MGTVRYALVLSVTVVLSLLCGSCMSSGEAYRPVQNLPDGKAAVYVYRLVEYRYNVLGQKVSALANPFRRPDVYINGDSVGCLTLNGCFGAAVPPGSVNVSIDPADPDKTLSVQISPGETRYVAIVNMFLDAGTPNQRTGERLREVDQAQAAADLRALKMERPFILDLTSVQN